MAFQCTLKTQTILILDKARADIPISNSEIFRMNVYLLKNNTIEDFTVQYEAIVDNYRKKAIRLPLKEWYTTHDIHKLVIRSDYGHKNRQQDKLKHTNIELLNTSRDKINKDDEMSFVEQIFDIPNYERAIHYVFMQAESYNL